MIKYVRVGGRVFNVGSIKQSTYDKFVKLKIWKPLNFKNYAQQSRES